MVEATMLIEEASTLAERATRVAGRVQGLDMHQLAATVAEMHTVLQRSSECMQKASTLIRVA
jgi:hypothetical protein